MVLGKKFVIHTLPIACILYTVGISWGFPGGALVKNPPADAGHAVSTPLSGRFPGVGNGHPLQYSCLEKSMDRGAWRSPVHGVAKNQT